MKRKPRPVGPLMSTKYRFVVPGEMKHWAYCDGWQEIFSGGPGLG